MVIYIPWLEPLVISFTVGFLKFLNPHSLKTFHTNKASSSKQLSHWIFSLFQAILFKPWRWLWLKQPCGEFGHVLLCRLANFPLNLHGISKDAVFRNSHQVVKVVVIIMLLKSPWFDYSSKNGHLYKLISLQIICSMFIHGWISWLEYIHFKIYCILLGRK